MRGHSAPVVRAALLMPLAYLAGAVPRSVRREVQVVRGRAAARARALIAPAARSGL